MQTPVAYLTCNFPSPVGDKPASFSHDDVRRLQACGVYAFLVGESLMREKDVAQAAHDLIAGAPAPRKAVSTGAA